MSSLTLDDKAQLILPASRIVIIAVPLIRFHFVMYLTTSRHHSAVEIGRSLLDRQLNRPGTKPVSRMARMAITSCRNLLCSARVMASSINLATALKSTPLIYCKSCDDAARRYRKAASGLAMPMHFDANEHENAMLISRRQNNRRLHDIYAHSPCTRPSASAQ